MSAYEPSTQTAAEIFELALAKRKAAIAVAVERIAAMIAEGEPQYIIDNEVRQIGNQCYDYGIDAGISGLSANHNKHRG